MSPPHRSPPRSRLSRSAPALAAVALAFACSGGGGGGGDGEDPGEGGVGTGADGVTVFWWKYGNLRYGAGAQALELPDEGFVGAGTRSRQTSSFDPSSYDAYVVRVDSRGALLWAQDVGEAGRQELSNDVILATDGSLLIAGEAYPSGPNPDMLLARLGADGAVQWVTTLGDDGWDSAQAALEVPGGFLVVGARTYQGAFGPSLDAVLVRVDGEGNFVEEKHFGGELNDAAYAFTAMEGGGYALAGSHGGEPGDPVQRIWLVRTEDEGLVESETTYGEGCAYGVVQTADGGFALTGYVPDAGGEADLVVLRLDADGAELWRRTFGGSDVDVGRSIALRPGGGFAVAGFTHSFTLGAAAWQRQDIYLIALEDDGDLIWQKVKGKAPDSSELADSVAPVADGGLILCGAAGARLLLMKADRLGQTVELGDFDVSLDIPDVPQGTIGFGNALDAAEAAVGLLFTARQVGPFALEHLTAVLSGTTPQQYCGLGGTYTILPPPAQPLAGQVFAVGFQACASAAPELRTIEGGYTLGVGAASEDILAPPFEIATTLSSIQVTVTDEAGPTSISAYLNYARSAASASAFDDWTELPAGKTLAIESDGLVFLSDELALASALSGGMHRLGPVLARVQCAAVPLEWLQVSIETADPLSGSDPLEPSLGSMAVEASDGSRVVLRARAGGLVELELDTDGDGEIDLVIPAQWPALY